MKKRTLTLLLAVAFAAMLITGCGKDDKGSGDVETSSNNDASQVDSDDQTADNSGEKDSLETENGTKESVITEWISEEGSYKMIYDEPGEPDEPDYYESQGTGEKPDDTSKENSSHNKEADTSNNQEVDASDDQAIEPSDNQETDMAAGQEDGGTYDNPSNEYTYEYSFHIPMINADTKGAKVINDEIKERYAGIENALFDIKDDGILSWEKYIEYCDVSYKTYWNDDIVSLIITGETDYDYTELYVACYDIKKGEKLTNKEIFKIGNISEDEWVRGMKKTVADIADREIAIFTPPESLDDNIDAGSEFERVNYWEYAKNSYMSLLDLRAQNINSEHINADLPVYLDDKGEVAGVVPVYGIAGGGEYNEELKPQTKFEGKNFTASMDGIINVKCEEGKITVTIEDGEWSRCSYLSDQFEFGKPYEVGGIFKDYVDCTFISFEDDTVSVPVFLSDDGMVSYIDLVKGTECGYLCMMEPLLGISELKELDGNTDQIKKRLEMVLYDNDNFFDSYLMGVSNYEWLETSVNHQTESGGNYLSNYSMGYASATENYRFLVTDSMPEADLTMYYEGICKFMGMNDEGKIFSYEISDEENTYKGTFLLNLHGAWDDTDEYYRIWAEYNYLGGVDFFDSNGKELHFEKSKSVG